MFDLNIVALVSMPLMLLSWYAYRRYEDGCHEWWCHVARVTAIASGVCWVIIAGSVLWDYLAGVFERMGV